MAKAKRETVREHLFWAYANLAMAHTAIDKKQTTYERFNFMIRAKLYKGLLTGSMNIRTLFDDEKIKLSIGTKCNYCDSTELADSTQHQFLFHYSALVIGWTL